MSAAVEYLSNKASEAMLAEHLLCCDAYFMPPLSCRVEIGGYAKKIANNAMRFEAWSGSTLVGLVAAYCNDNEKLIAYVTSVSVLKEWEGKGIAAELMKNCIKYMKTSGMQQITLEVASGSIPAIVLYEKCGFVAVKVDGACVTMSLQFSRHGR